jgi:cell division transport system permease protein
MRRKWITFTRIGRYGLANFARNAWLTTAATVIMTFTLTIILATFTLHLIFNDTLADQRQKIDISVYLIDAITPEQQADLQKALKALPSVTTVEYASKAENRQQFINANTGNRAVLEGLSAIDATNPIPASLHVHVSDTNHFDAISSLLKQAKYKAMQVRDASLNGSRKDAIENIGRAVQFAEIAGLVVSGLFLVLSIMVVFNTIRMAIFNRRDEIEIMKLIGAEKSFIRGPFIVEASLYGVFAAIVAVALLYGALLAVGSTLASADISIQPTIAFFTKYPALIFAGELAAGVVIGMISSLLAIRRYLRV